jgi:hypothetical protein
MVSSSHLNDFSHPHPRPRMSGYLCAPACAQVLRISYALETRMVRLFDLERTLESFLYECLLLVDHFLILCVTDRRRRNTGQQGKPMDPSTDWLLSSRSCEVNQSDDEFYSTIIANRCFVTAV